MSRVVDNFTAVLDLREPQYLPTVLSLVNTPEGDPLEFVANLLERLKTAIPVCDAFLAVEFSQPFSTIAELSALGCEVVLSRGFPRIRARPATLPDTRDVRATFTGNESVVRYLAMLRWQCEVQGFAIGAACGPLSLAAYLMGWSRLLRDIQKSPENLRRILDQTTVITAEWVRLQVEEGAAVIRVLEPYISSEASPPSVLLQLLASIRQLKAEIPLARYWIELTGPRIAETARNARAAGASVVSMRSDSYLETFAVKRALHGAAVFVATYALHQLHTRDEVEKLAALLRRVIHACGYGGAFFIDFEITSDTPIQTIVEILRLVSSEGKYPIEFRVI